MTTIVNIANLKGPQGQKGDQGDQGLPGVNGLSNDAAMAALVNTTSATRTALDARYKAQGFDIVVVAGQSNATKRSSVFGVVADADERVCEWDGTQIVTVPATDVQWLGNEFARQYVKDHPTRRVLIVPCAEGSSGFTSTSISPAPAGYHYRVGGTWDRTLVADPINLYANMVAKVNAAKAAAGAGAEVVALLWSQGEDDRVTQDDSSPGMTQGEYSLALDNMILQFRTDMGDDFLPAIIGSMTPETADSGTEPIRRALTDTPRRLQGTAYVPGPENMIEYNNYRVHFSPQGQAVRAREMATKGLYRALLNVRTNKPIMPLNLTARRTDATTVKAQWEFPPCQVSAFIVEFSVDAGTTWQYVPMRVVVDTSATFTAPIDATVLVRARTVSPTGTTDNTATVSVPPVTSSATVTMFPSGYTARWTGSALSGVYADPVDPWPATTGTKTLPRDMGTAPTVRQQEGERFVKFTAGSLKWTGTPGKTWVAVCRVTADAGDTSLQHVMTGGTPRLSRNGATGTVYATSGTLLTALTLPLSQWVVIVWTVDSTGQTVRINGNYATVTGATTLATEMALGRVSSEYGLVDFAEFIEYPGVLTEAQGQTIYEALKAAHPDLGIA